MPHVVPRRAVLRRCAAAARRKLLPFEVVPGGLTFKSGRVVAELGDSGDMAVIVVAAITVGY